jgi:selenocysteine lyase/cysteine desulfurase
LITKDMLEAQLRLYQNGHEQAISKHAKAQEALENAKRELAAFSGAIDCCQNLIKIAEQIEQAQGQGPPSDLPEPIPKE